MTDPLTAKIDTLHTLAPTGLDEKPGPWHGIQAYAGPEPATVKLPTPIGETGTVMLWLKIDPFIANGHNVEKDGFLPLTLPGLGRVSLWWYGGYAGVVWEGLDDNPNLPTEVPGLPGPQWMHLCYTWNAPEGQLDGYINGTPVRLPGRIRPWSPSPTSEAIIDASKWTMAGIRVSDQPFDRDAVLACIPSVYRGSLDHTLGAQNLGPFDANGYRGETLLENPLSDKSQLANWRMEGPGEFAIKDGWMRMWSTEPDSDGPLGHIVHWCDQDLPADFLLEFDCRIVDERGLNIIFFCATGRNGEDAFDPSLSERNGHFGHYHSGDLNCYHVSYYAHTPNAPGRATSNLRKNFGFFLVDNGPIGIPPADKDVHHIALLKQGGMIRLGVDGRCVIDWYDAGEQYGPVLGKGKIALRQMKWTIAEYQNLRVSEVKPH